MRHVQHFGQHTRPGKNTVFIPGVTNTSMGLRIGNE